MSRRLLPQPDRRLQLRAGRLSITPEGSSTHELVSSATFFEGAQMLSFEKYGNGVLETVALTHP